MRRSNNVFLRSTVNLRHAIDELAPSSRWIVEEPAKVTAHPIYSDRIAKVEQTDAGYFISLPKHYSATVSTPGSFVKTGEDRLTNRVYGWMRCPWTGAEVQCMKVDELQLPNPADVIGAGEYQVLPAKMDSHQSGAWPRNTLQDLWTQLPLWDDQDTAELSRQKCIDYFDQHPFIGIRFKHDDGRLAKVTAAECGYSRSSI